MQSLNTVFALAVQTALGTPAVLTTEDYFALTLESLGASGVYDYIESQNQARGIHSRSSSQQGTPIRSGFSVPVDGSAGLYPNTFAALLLGLGFLPLSTDPTGLGPYGWTFRKTDICDASYLSAYMYVPECVGATDYSKQIQDLRMTSATLNLAMGASTIDFTGFGLTELGGVAAPTTVIADSVYGISPVSGSLSFPGLSSVLGGSDGAVINLPISHTISINRPIDEADQKLHTTTRAAAEETGFTFSGNMSGLEMTYELYQELMWGGGTGPDLATVVSQVVVSLDDGRAANSHGFVIDITKAEVRFSNFRVASNQSVRADVQYSMIDDAAASPVDITFTNGLASYPQQAA